MHIPSQDALLAMPDNHLELLHVFIALVVEQAPSGTEKVLPHAQPTGSGPLVSIAVQDLARSCRALG